MADRILFDIETDGLYWDVTCVHCLCLKILGEDRGRCYTDTPVGGEDGTLADGLNMLSSAGELLGHNIINYDLAVLKKLHGFTFGGKVTDTLLLSKLLFPTIEMRDMIQAKRGRFPAKLIGRHSLEAWGHRLSNHKGSFCHETDWKAYSIEMQQYCLQDLEVNHTLYNRCLQEDLSEDALELETEVAKIISQQSINGWPFDLEKARELHLAWLEERDRMDAEITAKIPPFINREWFTPKVNRADLGYKAGVPFEKVTRVAFNPNSRQHITRYFREKYGWEPTERTEKGQPIVDEEVLKSLPYPEAPALAERFELQKHIGMLAEGKKAWIKLYNPDTGRLHGSIDTLGTRTRRMSHRDPNVAQVPAHSKYGQDCRSLFGAPEGYTQVGMDADALELRCLAHYMAAYDGGAYVDVVLNGSKEDGTDIHSRNAKALGLSRDHAKTWFYAFIYGAGDEKLGHVGSDNLSKTQAIRLGARRRAAFLASLPALARLTERAQALTKERGYLYSLDKQKLISPSVHAALNTLLQPAGAILMKRALVIADDKLRYRKIDFQFVANIHDEFQLLIRNDHVELAKQLLLCSIPEAGRYYNFRCPLSGEVKIGRTWADTH